jgi:hypothetical protein
LQSFEPTGFKLLLERLARDALPAQPALPAKKSANAPENPDFSRLAIIAPEDELGGVMRVGS